MPIAIWIIFGLLVAFNLGLGAVLFVSLRDYRKTMESWNRLIEATQGDELLGMLERQLNSLEYIKDTAENHETRLADCEAAIETAKRHVGMVKYDAFDDVAGKQSFSLALFDDRGDGVVVTTLMGRVDSRTYCKSLRGGKCASQLTPEEKKAIKLAAESLVNDGENEQHL
ncbi:MAG: DUF4446 family protein [Fimbriimonadaceae bacterium]